MVHDSSEGNESASISGTKRELIGICARRGGGGGRGCSKLDEQTVACAHAKRACQAQGRAD